MGNIKAQFSDGPCLSALQACLRVWFWVVATFALRVEGYETSNVENQQSVCFIRPQAPGDSIDV